MKKLTYTLIAIGILNIQAHQTLKQIYFLSSNTMLQNDGIKYRFVVSFISKGAGAKSNKRQELISYVKKHAKQPKYALIGWGREGETDFCFELKELNAKEQKKFIKAIRNMMKGDDLVIIYENTPAPNNGRVIGVE